MKRTNEMRLWTGEGWRIVWFAFLSAAAYLLFTPPETVMALTVPPDSSEYCVGLVNLFDHGVFGLTLNGVWYPSRYSPWFSLFCLTPVHFLTGGNVLCFNWAILAFALVLLGLIGAWGQRAGLGRWSLAAAALPLFLPDFVFYSRVVMTEIPYVTLFAASALVFLRFVESRQALSCGLCFGAGILIAWGGSVRPTLLPMILPFATITAFFSRECWRRRLVHLVLLVLPLVAYELANLGYNWAVFGDPMRSGYQFWMPVPCDFPELLFRFEYVWPNVRMLLGCPVIQITLIFMIGALAYAGAVLAGRFGGMRQNRDYLLLTGFLVLQALILVTLYIGYYWKDTRFFLPVTLCSIPLFLSAVRRILAEGTGPFPLVTLLLVLVFSLLVFLSSSTRYYPLLYWRQYWLEKAKISSQVLPANSVVVHDGDPNLLDHFGFRAKGLHMIPFTRRFDYVIHMIAPQSVRNVLPTPATAMPMIRPEFVAAGVCKLPFPETFQEHPGQIHACLAEGKRVFFEQEVLRGESGWEPFQDKLRELRLRSTLFGIWSSPETRPDPVRHVYDTLIFGHNLSDARPEIQAVYHEIIPDRGAGAR